MHEVTLTRSEFAKALKCGRGRALQYVRLHGLSDVGDLVLESCLTNPAYDRQSEGSRAAWLFQMFRNSQEYNRFSTAVLSALSSLSSEFDGLDLQQQCELAALMAKAGDDEAATVIRSRVLAQPINWPNYRFGCRPLVELDGLPAVVSLARRFGQLLIDEPDAMLPSVDDLTHGLTVADSALQELRRLAEMDEDIKRYLECDEVYALRERHFQQKTPDEWRREYGERVRNEFPLERILNDAARGVGNNPGQYMQFGKYATNDELNVILRRLVEETQQDVCRRLLWVFRRAPLPDLHPRIWQLADSTNDSLRYSAIQALAQSKDPRVGELARSKLRSGRFSARDSDTLDLFIRNYESADERLIISALTHISPDEDEAHNLGSSLLKICEANAACASLDMLKWVYGSTPCTVCRRQSVEQMKVIGVVPSDIVAECLDDADEDLRLLAKELTSS